ncbi:hypothetical protein R1CP_36550 (plasmid) [Rhodococcus opacus]|uniref:Uncharacterized protein n=1 Tax=Rhodococcus opacus TaxID=37919 RepID=A0A1B1KH33_RHOOP|nr:hypothetical protein R1CP_36550 [Rhodococcus opacus]
MARSWSASAESPGESSDSCEESFLSYECSVPQLGGCGIAAVGGDALQRNQRFPELVRSVGEVFEIDGVGARGSRESKRHAGKLNLTGRATIVTPGRPRPSLPRRARTRTSGTGSTSVLVVS